MGIIGETKMKNTIIIITIFLLCISFVYAQETGIVDEVTDEDLVGVMTAEPLTEEEIAAAAPPLQLPVTEGVGQPDLSEDGEFSDAETRDNTKKMITILQYLVIIELILIFILFYLVLKRKK